MQIFAALLGAGFATMIEGLPERIDSTRRAFVIGYAVATYARRPHRLGALAGHLHRLEPGVRLM